MSSMARTIILPTLAMEAMESIKNEHDENLIDAFMSILDKKIHEAKDMLLERFEGFVHNPGFCEIYV